jgi:hypothetical protein
LDLVYQRSVVVEKHLTPQLSLDHRGISRSQITTSTQLKRNRLPWKAYARLVAPVGNVTSVHNLYLGQFGHQH